MISYKPLFHTMIEKNISREQLRLMIGASPSTVSSLYTGKRVSLAVIEKICLALDVPVSSVFEVLPAGKDTKK